MNIVSLIGNVGQDPEIRYFESGTCKASFSLAHEEYKKDADNITHWLPCEAWGKTAETLANYVKKGHKLGVTGELLTQNWTDKDGNKRSKVFVKVNRIDLLTKKTDSNSSQSSFDNEPNLDDIAF